MPVPIAFFLRGIAIGGDGLGARTIRERYDARTIRR